MNGFEAGRVLYKCIYGTYIVTMIINCVSHLEEITNLLNVNGCEAVFRIRVLIHFPLDPDSGT